MLQEVTYNYRFTFEKLGQTQYILHDASRPQEDLRDKVRDVQQGFMAAQGDVWPVFFAIV